MVLTIPLWKLRQDVARSASYGSRWGRNYFPQPTHKLSSRRGINSWKINIIRWIAQTKNFFLRRTPFHPTQPPPLHRTHPIPSWAFLHRIGARSFRNLKIELITIHILLVLLALLLFPAMVRSSSVNVEKLHEKLFGHAEWRFLSFFGRDNEHKGVSELSC